MWQIEVAATVPQLLAGSSFAQDEEGECRIEDDAGEPGQDHHPLCTPPQFLGPKIEDILSAYDTVTLECTATTDQPLIDGETRQVHHGGNFQVMSVTNAMGKLCMALQNIGKLLFAQITELINPAMNRGLLPSLAATDPSHTYFAKGIDIHSAAYVSELGVFANPVSTHIQPAEMHNQTVKRVFSAASRIQ